MDRREPNVWKFISVVGIPITAILTWAFVAGGIVQDVKNNAKDIITLKSDIANIDSRVRGVELGIARIEVQYQQIIVSLNEIKNDLKVK